MPRLPAIWTPKMLHGAKAHLKKLQDAKAARHARILAWMEKNGLDGGKPGMARRYKEATGEPVVMATLHRDFAAIYRGWVLPPRIEKRREG